MPAPGAHLCPETHCGPGRGLPHGWDGGLCRVCLGLGGELRERAVMSELAVKVGWASWVWARGQAHSLALRPCVCLPDSWS